MPDFERVRTDALIGAVLAINFAIVRQLVRMAPDPEEALDHMRRIALRFLAASAGVRTEPADTMAEQLVETVFLG